MRKLLLPLVLLLTLSIAFAEEPAPEITFLKTSHDFGTFTTQNPVQTCTFKFTNTGNAPLYISQAIASCGCTVPTYTDKPVQPGDTGKIEVKYNGTGRYPGHFKKTITVRTNGDPEMTRLYIEGDMKESKKKN